MSISTTTLTELGQAYRTGKAVRGYLPSFERWLEPLRYEPLDLLEIGVHEGASIRMWHDYFPNARIIGLDIKNSAPDLDLPRYKFVQGNQGDQTLLKQLARDYDFRVIIDDGSHRWTHQIDTFKTLLPAMAPNGIYCCEGLLTSFGNLAARYGGESQTSAADFFLRLTRIIMAGSMWEQEETAEGDGTLRQLAALTSEIRILRHGVIVERGRDEKRIETDDVSDIPRLVASAPPVTAEREAPVRITKTDDAEATDSRVCQLLLTRFNIRSSGVGYSADQAPEWLDERLALFETYCLPSIAGQTAQDFAWVLFCDELTPEATLARIRGYDKRIRIARFARKDGTTEGRKPPPVSNGYLSPGDDPVLQNLSPQPFVPPGTEIVVTTRIDNDDALRADALERARAFIPRFLMTGHERVVYNPLLGYKLDTANRRLYATQMHNTPFLSVLERVSETTRPIGALARNHSHMYDLYPTYQADGHRQWVQVLHGGNVSNHVKSTDVELPVEELGPDFGFLP